MVCPIVLNNISTTNILTINDLGFITLPINGSIELSSLYSVERITSSANLQSALRANIATIVYGGITITDLADLCFLIDADLASASAQPRYLSGFIFSDVPAGTNTDFFRAPGLTTADMPYLISADSVITELIVAKNGGGTLYSFDVGLLKVLPSGTTELLAPTTVTNSNNLLTFAGLPIGQGEKLRLQFFNTSSNVVSKPQIVIKMVEI